MLLSEFKKKNERVFRDLEESTGYIVYYANTETCTDRIFVNIEYKAPGLVSSDNLGYKQDTIRAGYCTEALINHLFMNSDIYQDIQGIEANIV